MKSRIGISPKELIKKYYNYILFIIVAVATCYIIYKEVDLKSFWHVVQQTNYAYLGLAFLCLFVYWIMEAFMLKILISREYPDETLGHSFSLMMIGQYYNLVTPSSTGGQPMQLLDMVEKGIKPGFATAVLVQKYALYQLSVTLIGIIGVLSNMELVKSWPPIGHVLLVVGIIVNLFGSILILLIAFEPRIAKSILDFFVVVGKKIHLIKDENKWYNRINSFVSDYKIAISGFKSRVGESIFLLAFNVVAILVYYAIVYMIYKALGLSNLGVFKIILIQSVLYLMIAFIPLPGSTGGAEIGFTIVFGAIFGMAASSVGLITWRIITFFFILIFAGIYIAVRTLILAGKKKQEKLEPVKKDDAHN